MPNNSAINAACAITSCFATHLTRPFRIMLTASIPWNVRHAVENDLWRRDSLNNFFLLARGMCCK